MPALQRSEALTRARQLQVHGYTVDLDLTRGEEVFGSTTVIRFGCTEPGSDTFLDLQPAALHRVVLNGRPLDPADLDGNRLVLSGLAAENELLVEAEMRYSRTGEGLHRFTDPADGAVYLYASCGPDMAPQVFPCFDQPDLKAPFTLAATAPADWSVIANGSGGRTAEGRWEFAPTLPISTYLVTLVAGPLHSVYSEHDGIPLGLHSRRSLAADLDREAAELFEVTRASFDRLHELFDERYPFGRYDQAFVPEFNWGAMENPGCVVFREELLFHSAPTEAERESRAMVVAHEMAHMWFGDLVTMRWWDDLWLNESFAEYLGYRIAAENTRFTGAWTSFAVKRKGWGYDADQRSTTHPIAMRSMDSVADALVNFDGIAYAKGASALRQLVAWLGDEAFFAGINEHFARHRFGNADLADFLDALATTSGRDVQGWAERWLRTSGVDTLRLELAYEGDKVVSAELVPGGTRPHRVGIGVFDGQAPALVLRDRFEAEVEPGRRTPLPQLAGAPRAALVLPNHGDLTWAKIRLDADSWQTVTESLAEIEDPLVRAVLWENARDLVQDAELSPGRYLDLVAAQLPDEPVDSIVEAVLTFARQRVIGSYLAPADRPAAHALLGSVCRTLLARPGAGEGLRLAALRGAVENAQGEELAELQDWLEHGGPGVALSSQLRWAALGRLAAGGVIGEERIAAELAADPSSSAHEGAALARAARPERAAKEQAWQELFSGVLSNHLLTATSQGFWQSGSEELQQEYLERYFAELPAAGRRSDIVARALGSALFPAGWSTPEAVGLAETCLAGEELTPALRRVLADRLDDLRRAVRIRG
ncbi:aminopeptidase N [Kitasatospora atroaurantiaca]|uniref:Aminopeptidase N n=1 Tax=Kitasatospora atroaurantiaca TaxID=285545 RepID=A0A561EWT8_9ACTN|nr:aminopeptidase N [Kitasatospora atroaurantiaca]TWE20084.1 membrane alanyl aminopeptidase [Kitasatospora atroaurantiaca]